MIFRPELSWESLSQEEIRTRTLRALRNHIRHIKTSSSFYSELLFDVSDDTVASFDDFRKLPFTDATTLAKRNDAFCMTGSESITETVLVDDALHTSTAIPVFLTASDADRMAFDMALGLHACGVTSEDTVLLLIDMNNPDMVGLSIYHGLKLLGANVIRAGDFKGKSMKTTLQRLRPSVFAGTLTSLNAITTHLGECGLSADAFSDKKVFCAGYDLRNDTMQLNQDGAALAHFFGAHIFSFQPLGACQSALWECPAQKGLHIHPELTFAEIIDEQERVITDDKPGELVITTLGIEGMPLLRFKTGKHAFALTDSCSCGRNSRRIVPIDTTHAQSVSRESTQESIPGQITRILDSFEQIQDYVVIIEHDAANNRKITIHALISPQMVHTVYRMLHAKLNIDIPILVSNPATIQSIRGTQDNNGKIIDTRSHR